jgi:hypothetical protein
MHGGGAWTQEENELIDRSNEVEKSLPRNAVGLNDGNSFHRQEKRAMLGLAGGSVFDVRDTEHQGLKADVPRLDR